jgi:hypothetical protein
MRWKSILKKLMIPMLLVIAFYLGGYVATSCEVFHESILLACSVFTATFTSVMALGTKIYFIVFS